MPTTARQFWIRAPGQGEIRTAALLPRAPDHVLVRALYSGISRGTETLVFRGEVPPSQHQTMRAPFQEGDFPGPVKYGYSSVGEVLETAETHRDTLLGKRVFCLYPHQDLYTVPAAAACVLPEDLPPARAVLAASMETAVNAVWDAGPSAGDGVVVIGGGAVGLLVGWLCRQVPGARVTVVDPDPMRESVARELGLDFTDRPPVGADADVVVHASGSPEGLAAALSVAGVEAKVVEVSWYGSRPITVALGEAFHSRRLTLQSSQVGRIPPGRATRWSHARRMELALDLLRDPRLDLLITGESEFELLPDVMARLSGDGRGVLCHRIRYSHP
ncbi:MAG: zinc-binding alcohol dehydrogenase [Gemmatimonadetes bacterium]|nr:zinc-binding alcohol dehydrogenase [Gemmatimonadota bacterium]